MESVGKGFNDVLASHCELGGALGIGATGSVRQAKFVWEGPDNSEVSIGPVARKKLFRNLLQRRRERALLSNTRLAAGLRHVPGYAFFKGSGSEKMGGEPVIYSELIDTGWNYRDFVKNAEEIPPLTRLLHACIFLRLRLQAWKTALEAGILNTDQKPANNIPTDFALYKIPSNGEHAFVWLPERVVMVDMDNLVGVGEITPDSPSELSIGTVAYMAPEQTRSFLQPESELFSIGTSAMEILTGQRVFCGQVVSCVLEDIKHRSQIIIHDFLQDMVAPMADDLPPEYRSTLMDFQSCVEALTRYVPQARPSTEEKWAEACRNNPLLMEGPGAIGQRCENVRGVTREQIIRMISLRTGTEKLL